MKDFRLKSALSLTAGALLAGLLVSTASACGPDIECGSDDEVVCDYQSDEERCMCAKHCAVTSDCPRGYVCAGFEAGIEGMCVLTDWPQMLGPGESCRMGACAAPLVCLDGTCTDPCGGCTEGYTECTCCILLEPGGGDPIACVASASNLDLSGCDERERYAFCW